MPTAQPPATFHCRHCGWKRTLPVPLGDCRVPGVTHFTACPECGRGDAITQRSAGPLELIAARIKQNFPNR